MTEKEADNMRFNGSSIRLDLFSASYIKFFIG